MSVYVVFRASGDSCGICLGLDGQRVPEGYKPHSGCTCETVIVHQDGDCKWNFTFAGYGSGDIVGAEVEVTCPDGSTISDSIEVHVPQVSRAGGSGDPEADALLDAAEEHAHALCEECQTGDDDFRCC